MKILGLAGPAGAGKDTAAGYVLEWAGLNGVKARRQGFADILKVSAATALGMPYDQATQVDPTTGAPEAVEFCNALKERGMITVDLHSTQAEIEAGSPDQVSFTGREFLQWYGTEAHRDVFGQEFWVEAFENAVLPHGPDDPRFSIDLVVVPDVRFKNEAQMVNSVGGQIWQVHRSGVQAINSHSSESGLPDEYLTCSVMNEGSLDDLRSAVFSNCDTLLGE